MSSTVHGVIKIEPPLTYAELKDSPLGPDVYEIAFVIDEAEKETGDGTFITRSAKRLVSGTEGSFNFYGLEDRLLDVAKRYGATHRFVGYLVRFGDENSDVERYSIQGSDVHREQAELLWPDGSRVTYPDND